MKHSNRIESSLKPMPLRPIGPNYCWSRRITLIFDIFRIGVVTGYREAMLNLFNPSASNVWHIWASFISYSFMCGFVSCYFMSCIFMSCHLVRHFHVLLFHALQIGPSISRPSFSRPAFSAPPSLAQGRSTLIATWLAALLPVCVTVSILSDTTAAMPLN